MKSESFPWYHFLFRLARDLTTFFECQFKLFCLKNCLISAEITKRLQKHCSCAKFITKNHGAQPLRALDPSHKVCCETSAFPGNPRPPPYIPDHHQPPSTTIYDTYRRLQKCNHTSSCLLNKLH